MWLVDAHTDERSIRSFLLPPTNPNTPPPHLPQKHTHIPMLLPSPRRRVHVPQQLQQRPRQRVQPALLLCPPSPTPTASGGGGGGGSVRGIEGAVSARRRPPLLPLPWLLLALLAGAEEEEPPPQPPRVEGDDLYTCMVCGIGVGGCKWWRGQQRPPSPVPPNQSVRQAHVARQRLAHLLRVAQGLDAGGRHGIAHAHPHSTPAAPAASASAAAAAAAALAPPS